MISPSGGCRGLLGRPAPPGRCRHRGPAPPATAAGWRPARAGRLRTQRLARSCRSCVRGEQRPGDLRRDLLVVILGEQAQRHREVRHHMCGQLPSHTPVAHPARRTASSTASRGTAVTRTQPRPNQDPTLPAPNGTCSGRTTTPNNMSRTPAKMRPPWRPHRETLSSPSRFNLS
jgi:hypothetical protein